MAVIKTARDRPVAITPEMVEIAANVLEESGYMEYWPGAPALLLVRRMLKAAQRDAAGKRRCRTVISRKRASLPQARVE